MDRRIRVTGVFGPGLALFVSYAAGCSHGGSIASGAVTGATTESPGAPPSACTTPMDAGACTLPPGVTLPLAPPPGPAEAPPPNQSSAGLSNIPVTVAQGTGDPPVAQGGAVDPGTYELVAATVYGALPPNTGLLVTPGQTIGAVLQVSCDSYGIAYGVAGDGGAGMFEGSQCGRLVPFAIPLPALAGLVDAGAVSSDSMPYSASPGKLTLIDTEPYEDFGLGLVEGSFTVVQEFVAKAAATGATPTAQPPSPAAPSAARDPRCPATPPESTTSCDPTPAPLECEYGGDALGRCTTLFACALQADGSFQFVLAASPPQDGCAAPAACPSTFAAAEQAAGTEPCDGAGTPACDYAEGTCACTSTGATADAGAAYAWTCHPRVSENGCPATRPLSGAACTQPELQCFYGTPCLPPYEGMPLVCRGGYWEAFDAEYSCPVRATGP